MSTTSYRLHCKLCPPKTEATKARHFPPCSTTLGGL
jgi:hypothetical protein